MNLFQKIKAFYAPFTTRLQYFYLNNITKKRFLFLAFFSFYASCFIYYTHQYPKETTLYFSKGAEKISDYQIPQFARKLVFETYAKIYNVNQEEMMQKIQQYKCFSQFFTRKIKPRQISKENQAILSPSDSKILAFGEITSDSVFVVKGYSYSLGELICGNEVQFNQQDIQNMKKNKLNKLYHCVLYLAPGDYHRFHSASDVSIFRRKTIDGALFPVNQKSLIKNEKVYQKNSRLILHGKWKQGYLAMILVGALNVGRIVVKQKLEFQRGEEIGYFNLGSTIVLIFQSPEIEWKVQEKQSIKYGEILAICNKSQKSFHKN